MHSKRRIWILIPSATMKQWRMSVKNFGLLQRPKRKSHCWKIMELGQKSRWSMQIHECCLANESSNSSGPLMEMSSLTRLEWWQEEIWDRECFKPSLQLLLGVQFDFSWSCLLCSIGILASSTSAAPSFKLPWRSQCGCMFPVAFNRNEQERPFSSSTRASMVCRLLQSSGANTFSRL